MRKKIKVEVCRNLDNQVRRGTKEILVAALIIILTGFGFVRNAAGQQYYQQNSYNPPPNTNFLKNSQAFRQEIARVEITVHREGKMPLSLSQVPRVEKGDVIRFKLLNEAVNGIRIDQSLYNWTLLVAFVNPNRKVSGSGRLSVAGAQKGERREGEANGEGQGARGEVQSSVSEEIEFRKKGWYREHSFVVPYDSQPVFFLYPRPNYRSRILGLINRNYNEIRKLGDKTIDLAGAYAQIGMFLNELQGVLSGTGYYGNSSGYGNYGGYNQGYNGYNPYNTYKSYNPYTYNPYGAQQSYNYNLLVGQSVERLARSFNIQLPNNCWQSGLGSSPGSYGFGNNQNGISPEMVGRLQCVAKSIRLEDFDLSVSRMLQQGGILLAAQLQQKYPQIAHWIGIAALAVDFIVKVFKKTAMRVVPTVTSSSDNPVNNYGVAGGYQSYQSSPYHGSPANSVNPGNSANFNAPMPKISLFAENQPDDNQFVTAYPLILHKWQAEPDAEVISLRPPVLMEACLHAGVNVLKSTDLTEDQLSDNFTKDYVLTMTSPNGFRKEFPLKKNIGLSGWELNITPQDLQEFPKIRMTLESVIKGTRGFNEIKSPPFYLPIAIGGAWEITPETRKDFTVGGRRTITIRNALGNCRCLQSVVYRPPFGGQFVFAAGDRERALEYSPDGREVSFQVDAASFQPGEGKVELRTYGGEKIEIPLKLYAAMPNITNLKIGKGDCEGIISGERLEQIQSIRINGKRAVLIGINLPPGPSPYANPGYQNQPPAYGNQPTQPTTYGNPKPPGSGNSPGLTKTYVRNLQAAHQGERVFVFEDQSAMLTENTALIELVLEDNRAMALQRGFPVAPARPSIVSDGNKEVDGVAVRSNKPEAGNYRNDGDSGVGTKPGTRKGPKPHGINSSSPAALPASTLPVGTDEITVNAQNALTDHDFRIEKLSVETRLENSQSGAGFNPVGNQLFGYGTEISLPKVEFEVLDWKNLRISFRISSALQKILGGRRLQFRLLDRERGVSDWYTIRQTFVRMPRISSITCTQGMNGMCQMNGPGIDYIAQISVDGGQTWSPPAPGGLQVQPTADGQKSAMIPFLQNKKLLKVKLRDYPNSEGIFIGEFIYKNTSQQLNKSTK